MDLLASKNPTAATTSALFDELAKHEVANDHELWRRRSEFEFLVDELAIGGEPELELVASELRSPDRRRRHWAAYVLLQAAKNPLVLPDARAALAVIAREHNLTGTHAANAVREFEAWEREDPDPDAVAATAARVSPVTAIRILGRRRFFCRSFVATAMLETYRSESDPVVKMLAHETIKLREQRCGSSLARKPRSRDPIELLAEQARLRNENNASRSPRD